MQLWEKILQLALLGSERSHLDPDVADALRPYGLDPEDPLPSLILSGAATLHQLRKLQPAMLTPGSALPDPAPEAAGDVLSGAAVGSLQQILSGRYRPALREFVRLLVANQRLLPPEFLPELLEDCLRDPQLWRDLQPLLGGRAGWLIDQHPEWSSLRPQGDPARWDRAGRRERVRILGALRREDPAAALKLLQTSWEAVGFREKLDYLSALASGLGPSDEAFLETVLDDSRKEVRLKAADLLASIPDSGLVERLFEQVSACFRLASGKERLKVQLPTSIPEATARDGVQPQVTKGKTGGLKVDWLFQCVSRIPPARWMVHFEWEDPMQLMAAFNSSDRADLLLGALARACVRFEDRDTAGDLIGFLVLHGGRVPEGLDWPALMPLVSAARIDEIAREYWARQSGLLDEHHLLTRILERGDHPWSETTAGRVVLDLKEWMATSKTFLWNLWHYKRLLETAGYCSPVELLPELGSDWPVQSPVWNQWAPDLERMLRILRFRTAMADQLRMT